MGKLKWMCCLLLVLLAGVVPLAIAQTALSGLGQAASSGSGQAWPSRPIRINLFLHNIIALLPAPD